MAKEMKEINLDDQEMPTVVPEENENRQELIEDSTNEIVESSKTDAEEVLQVISSYFSKKTKKTMKGFFESFLKATDEYSDLSMQNYKSFLEAIQQNVSKEEYPKYQEIFAKVLLARKKRIEAHDSKQNFEKFKFKILNEIEVTYQNVNPSLYASSKLATIDRVYSTYKQQIEVADTKEKIKLLQHKFESSIRSVRTKKSAKRRLGIIIGCLSAVVAVLAAILCIGAIPRVVYSTVAQGNDYEYDKNGNMQLVTKRATF